ncbi:MAG: ABC transporter permease [Thermoanaerobaculia bacterium]
MSSSDWKMAPRNVRRAPGAAAAVILVVAIGVAATATIFAVVDALYLRPLPGVDRPAELVNVHATSPDGSTFHSVSYPTWRELAADGGPFSGLTAFSSRLVSVGTGGEPRLAIAQVVTGNYFQVLGAKPSLGRLLTPADGSAGAPPAAVVSEAAWRDRFGADPAAIGRTALVNGRPYSIVGVPAPGFTGTFLRQPFDVWLTIGGAGPIAGVNAESPDRHWLELVGRQRAGVSLPMVSRALAVMSPRLEREWRLALRRRSARRACARIGRVSPDRRVPGRERAAGLESGADFSFRRPARGLREDRMNGLLRDVRYALRTLSRSPGFAFVAIATHALEIGANTAEEP